MSTSATATTTFLLLLLLLLITSTTTVSCTTQERLALQAAKRHVLKTKDWIQASITTFDVSNPDRGADNEAALRECFKLYEDSEFRLSGLLGGKNYTRGDARTWLSSVLANHRTCFDELGEEGLANGRELANSLTSLVGEALALSVKRGSVKSGWTPRPRGKGNGGLLASWNGATSRADIVVAQDGSGNHTTINEALAAVKRMGSQRGTRLVIHVKAGIYKEKVEIESQLNNIMFVGDGMDRTIVTGSRNVPDGSTTLGSATFAVFGDGFWARDMTFENTAGPHKHQAVALSVRSDLSIFYRCSFKGYQDTLYTHSLRQFYRDCHIYGTIDFIFGDAPAILQNCDIFVRKPMEHQSNMITAQGRDNPAENTGIVIHESRIMPAPDFVSAKKSFESYLGRPWKKYSRTVIMKTDLDGLIDPKGWTEWSGSFALSTLFYGEYMNIGAGASTERRVNWPGFHVLRSPREATPFGLRKFLQGEMWIPASGVPFSLEI